MPDNFGFWGDLARGIGNAILPGDPFTDHGAIGRQVASNLLGTDRDGTTDWNPFPDADDATGRAGQMLSGAGTPGCSTVLPVIQKTINRAPRGYVVVYPDDPSGRTGTPVAMLKSVARSCGYWKPTPKPVMTSSDMKTLRKADRLQKKVDRIAKMANSVGGKAPLRRVRGKR